MPFKSRSPKPSLATMLSFFCGMEKVRAQRSMALQQSWPHCEWCASEGLRGAVPGCVKMGCGASLICSLCHILQSGHVLPGILVAERFHCAIQGDNSKGAARNVNGVLTFCTTTGRFTCSLQSRGTHLNKWVLLATGRGHARDGKGHTWGFKGCRE